MISKINVLIAASNIKALNIPFRQLCTFTWLSYLKWNEYTYQKNIQRCLVVTWLWLDIWGSICSSDESFLRSLKEIFYEVYRQDIFFFIWHPDLLQPLGVKIVWAPSLIQPLRKGSGSYVLNPLPDKCHQDPNACWQEADLKKQFSRKEISLMA